MWFSIVTAILLLGLLAVSLIFLLLNSAPIPTPPIPTPPIPTPTPTPIEVCSMVSTVAGSTAGEPGYANGTSAEARFNLPQGIDTGAGGSFLYVADYLNHAIRKVELPGGQVSTVAGSTAGEPGYTDGPSAEARFVHISGLAWDASGSVLYVADSGNHAIRKVELPGGEVSTVAGSTAGEPGYTDGASSEARFNNPSDLVMGAGGTFLYVTDTFNHSIRAIELLGGQVSTVAGSTAGEDAGFGYTDGASSEARFYRPQGLALGAGGTFLYVADSYNNAIRAIKLPGGQVSTVAGSTAGNEGFGYTEGPSAAARFFFPTALSVGLGGTSIYVADTYNHAIRAIELPGGQVSTVAGTSTEPRFFNPQGLALGGTLIYVADTYNHVIRKIELC
jgi:hypothetical protein